MQKVLIANRGEIACRIIRTCRKLGLGTVAVFSEADAAAQHAILADDACPIGPAKAAESYLRSDRLIEAARRAGADAVHPGYGFLAENETFARQVVEAGLTWVGPSPESIAEMGDKERARRLARAAGVPVLPGTERFAPDALGGLERAAAAIGYPLLVKAAAGGGGIGMRRVDGPDRLLEVVRSTQAIAQSAFGDGTIYLEHFVVPARHIEIQVFGFGDGRAVHLFERECSIQRRFQKILEESRAPNLSPATLARMADAAVALAGAQKYRGAGTVEFVVGPDERFYFLEMNTRIQVEHPVTEMLTGVDLVELQLRLAAGDGPALTQASIAASGHAIEGRIYAERPEMNFLPSPGPLSVYRPPRTDRDLRIDSGYREGDQVTFHYDPMIAKIIARGETREAAIGRLAGGLAEFAIEGLSTNLPFLRRLVLHPEFRSGRCHTGFVEAHIADLRSGGT